MMNDQSCNTPNAPQQIQMTPVMADVTISREKRTFSTGEKWLLPVALIVAVLCDRLLFAPILSDSSYVTKFAGVFWLCYLATFYWFYWKRLSHNRVLWFVTGCCTALCAWNFFFTNNGGNFEFSLLTYLVIPAVLMAHAQFAAGDYKLKDAGEIAIAWLLGWLIKPFSGIPTLFGAADSIISGGSKSAAKKTVIGIVITLPLLCIIVPLLCGADRVFGYYLKQMVGSWNFSSLVGHTIIVALAFMFFYSFLWNVGFGTKEKIVQKTTASIDPIICYIVLGSVTLLYTLFCIVQFTYLFAGAGLPDGLTYSEYAREGFAQTVAVCAINLLIFGIFLQFGTKRKSTTSFLTVLLTLTGVMLFSGFVRLRLYIDAYGLTWLRILSAWFVIYLAVVVVLCGIRMIREKLPAVAMCALILLGWYVALGYSNPDALIVRYNQSHNYDTVEIR